MDSSCTRSKRTAVPCRTIVWMWRSRDCDEQLQYEFLGGGWLRIRWRMREMWAMSRKILRFPRFVSWWVLWVESIWEAVQSSGSYEENVILEFSSKVARRKKTMEDYVDVDDLPIGVSRNAFKIPRRFRHDWSIMTASTSSFSTRGNANVQLIKTRSVSSRRNRAPRSYGFAVRDATSYYWKFMKMRGRLCDVDTRKYPYFLVRGDRLPMSSIGREQQCLTRYDFLNCFNNDYIQAAVQPLHEIATGGLTFVEARFGRKMFRQNSREWGHFYRWSSLCNAQFPSDLQSSWSNVCDTSTPVMNSLIDALNQAEGTELVPKLTLTIRCCLKAGGIVESVKLRYVRQHDQWVFQGARGLLGVHACHDIFLDSGASVRVKVHSVALAATRSTWWSSIHNLIQIHDSSVGDPFATKVTLAPHSCKDLRIDFVSIKREYTAVSLHGLSFQRCETRGGVCLQVHPPREMLEAKQAAESFEFLVKRLVQVLDAFS